MTEGKINIECIQEKIIEEWRQGETVSGLASKYKTYPKKIKDIIVYKIGLDEYRKGCKKRMGAGTHKRKENPTYSAWMREPSKNFRHIIKRTIIERKLTISNVANLAGMSYSTLLLYLKGTTETSTKNLEKLLNVLRIQVTFKCMQGEHK
jgi:hypothetical protein